MKGLSSKPSPGDAGRTPPAYEVSAFLNVPFDKKYTPLSNALVFAIYDCGFLARSALEVEDSGQARVEKILDIIADRSSAFTTFPVPGSTETQSMRVSTCRSSSGSSWEQNASVPSGIRRRGV